MNTPAHLVVNLALLGRERPEVARWVAAGALLPDLPMFAFYLWQRVVAGAGEAHIWSTAYFEPAWQRLFDGFNSVPLFALLGVLAWALGQRGPAWGCASVLLHCFGDAFLHREDGHRHLWPLSDERFMSPVSYWDPAHHGALGSGLETLLVLGASLLLWPKAGRAGKIALASLASLAVVAWTAFYALGALPSAGGGAG